MITGRSRTLAYGYEVHALILSFKQRRRRTRKEEEKEGEKMEGEKICGAGHGAKAVLTPSSVWKGGNWFMFTGQ